MAKSSIKTISNAGNLYLIFLGLLLMAMGGAFMFFMWLSFAKANKTRSWNEVPCRVLSSEKYAEERTPGKVEFQWRGLFSYEVGGRQYTSPRYELRGARWTTKEEKVDAILNDFPTSTSALCFVNPEDPTYAILKHDSRGAGYSIWFPGLFAVGGIGMIVGAIRKWNK